MHRAISSSRRCQRFLLRAYLKALNQIDRTLKVILRGYFEMISSEKAVNKEIPI